MSHVGSGETSPPPSGSPSPTAESPKIRTASVATSVDDTVVRSSGDAALSARATACAWVAERGSVVGEGAVRAGVER
jgi:hypothetical protein